MKKVVLVTGASSGIGLQTALLLLKNGFTVYGCARRTQLLSPIIENGGNGLFLDVTDSESIKNCVNTIIQKEKRIDILINNAGYGLGGCLEDVSIQEAKNQFDVNVFGLVALTKEVLPYMRNQHEGRIINIASIAARFSSPFLGWYHATKYSVEALSETLRIETRDFGIKVVIIEPGLTKTDWGLIAATNIKKNTVTSDYKSNAKKTAEFYEKKYRGNITNPLSISNLILKACTKKNPKNIYRTGKLSFIVPVLHEILPSKVYDFLFTKIMYKQ